MNTVNVGPRRRNSLTKLVNASYALLSLRSLFIMLVCFFSRTDGNALVVEIEDLWFY